MHSTQIPMLIKQLVHDDRWLCKLLQWVEIRVYELLRKFVVLLEFSHEWVQVEHSLLHELLCVDHIHDCFFDTSLSVCVIFFHCAEVGQTWTKERQTYTAIEELSGILTSPSLLLRIRTEINRVAECQLEFTFGLRPRIRILNFSEATILMCINIDLTANAVIISEHLVTLRSLHSDDHHVPPLSLELMRCSGRLLLLLFLFCLKW